MQHLFNGPTKSIPLQAKPVRTLSSQVQILLVYWYTLVCDPV